MKKSDLSMMLAAILAAGFMPPATQGRRYSRPVKECLSCGSNHQHNNSFCSPECCKKYREVSA